MGLPGVNDNGSRFPGKTNPLQTAFFFFLDRSVEHWGVRRNNEQSCQRQRQKQNPRQKTAKCAVGQHNESAENFQNYDSRRLLTFFCGGWYLHKEKQTSFLTLCKANFGMTVTVTSLFEIWTPAWSFPGSSSLHEGIVFFSWQNGTLSFFFRPVFYYFFFYSRLSFALLLHKQRSFHKRIASTSDRHS